VVIDQKFIELFSLNAGRNSVGQIGFGFWISLSVPEIFALNVKRGPKSRQIQRVIRP